MESVNWLNYLGQINLYIAVSIGFYWLVLKKETFFQVNRAFLIGSTLLAFFIPFWKLGIIQDLFITNQVSDVVASFNLEELVISPSTQHGYSLFTWKNILITIYLLGFGTQCLRFIMAFFLLQKTLSQNSLSGKAFSFFHKIFVDKDQLAYDIIYAHEEVHSQQLHTFDILWVEIVSTLCWFNPLVYLLKKEVKLLHEFIADEQVSQLTGTQAYAELLVATHFKTEKNVLVHNFNNQSILKNRIMKLAQKKSNRVLLFKYAFAMPLFGAMLLFSAANASTENVINTLGESLKASPAVKTIVNIPQSITDKQAITSETSTNNITPTLPKNDSTIYKMVDQNPEFPGGTAEMYTFIGSNMVYPETAIRANVEGRVFVKFVVKADGSIGNIDILKGLGFGCDQEALRVINLMPKWKPGYQNGEKVNVYYTMPVVFRLNEEVNIKKESRLHMEALYVINNQISSFEIVQALNPEKIQKINVIKDQSAIDKYGEKGINGVIEISLKE